MKKLFISISIYLLQISFIIYGYYFNQSELTNIAIWFTWAIILASTFALFADPAKLFLKKSKYPTLPMILSFILLCTLLATNYFWTGTAYGLVWFFLYGKKKDWEKELKSKKDN